MESVEYDREPGRSPHRQCLIGVEQPIVVLDDEPAAHGIGQFVDGTICI